MKFKIEEHNGNIDVILMECDTEKSRATCYFINTPINEGKRIGTIGDINFGGKECGSMLLKKCEEILKEKGVDYVVAPMNENTWHKYRTLKFTNGDPNFLLENINPIEDNEILKNNSFDEICTYTSTKGKISDAYTSEVLEDAKAYLKENNIIIRNFNKENAIEELTKIYNVSSKSFDRNPFYTPITEKEFLKQYEEYLDFIDNDFVLITEKDGKEIGFVFCVPNYIEQKLSGTLKTLILKTIAVLPEYENLAIGNVMLKQIAEAAEKRGFEDWIFAFMYSNNTSQKMAKRNKTEIIREYALYGKKI